MNEPVLSARGVTKRFGGLTAVDEVDLEVAESEIVGLIGPNGAGKTTFFNCLTGMEEPTAGDIRYRGKRLKGRPYDITGAGLARTFQNIRLFPNMTALENVLVGRHCRTKAGVFAAIGRGVRFRREERESEARARELLDFVGLPRVADELAKNLPYGDQRRLEIARALATRPKVLLLDEPAAGMNPQEKVELMELIRKEFKVAILLIEHDMKLVMSICEKITVLDHGEIIACDCADAIQTNPKVVEAYLGEPTEA